MKKYTVSLFAILCVCLAFISCKEVATDTISDALKEIKKDLPMDMGEGLMVTAVDLEENAIVMKMECPNEMVAALQLVDEKQMKEGFIEGFKNSENSEGNDNFIDLCLAAEKGLSIRIVGTGDDHPEYHIEIPYEEISKLKTE